MRSVPTHRPARPPGPSRHRVYDRTARDAESKRFYHSSAWLKARLAKLGRDPLCGRCLEQGRLEQATVVHHRVELRADRSLALDPGNLESLCAACHGRLHASR